ncbi:hypothetical protein, partial [Vibrio parahaemolyticus]|uniref:hypothetical protein n=1 Tax=Vibrio parahaemolyticus TaxID=670 RepID=UPI001E601F84
AGGWAGGCFVLVVFCGGVGVFSIPSFLVTHDPLFFFSLAPLLFVGSCPFPGCSHLTFCFEFL